MILWVHNRLLVVLQDGKYGASKMTNEGKSTDREKELFESLQSWILSKSCYYEQVNKKDLKLWGNKKFLGWTENVETVE